MSTAFPALSDTLAAAVQAASAGTVRVDARPRRAASGIVWSADGVIVTAQHVVEHDEVTVGLPDGREVAARLGGRDTTTDLAVLRAEAGDLAPLAWAEPGGIAVGQVVLAIARPGRTVQATLGVVSAWGGDWRTPAGGKVDHYLQTDVVMYPGFSGGPLIGAGGQVVGLNTSGLLRGVSLALPLPTVRHVVEALLAHGRVRRGYLGISAQVVRLPDGLAKTLQQESGLILIGVEPDSPAAQADLHMGDTLVAIGDQPLRHMDDLIAALAGDRIGQTAQVRFIRGAGLFSKDVMIGERG